MATEAAERHIRRAIAGNREALAWMAEQNLSTEDPVLLTLGALLTVPPTGMSLLDRAATAATSRQDRQLVALARAHLAGDRQLVDALARDHLVDFPASYLVAWIAAGAEPGGGT